MTLSKIFGKHYLVELIDCDSEKIKFVADVRKLLLDAAKECKVTILEKFFHQFEPYGVSGIILIAESHIALHTWPEDTYVAVDIFTCGQEMDVNRGIDMLMKGFNAKKVKSAIMPRGI